MSIMVEGKFGGESRYEVVHRDNVILVKGAVPVEAMLGLAKMGPKGAVMDTDLAQLAGATMAFGLEADCDRLRAKLAEEARKRLESDPRLDGLSSGAKDWLAKGCQGMSSGALFFRTVGIRPRTLVASDNVTQHPTDASSLYLCLLMLEQVPEAAQRLETMRDVSPEWSALIDRWDDLKQCFLDEVGLDWPKGRLARNTAALLDEILASP